MCSVRFSVLLVCGVMFCVRCLVYVVVWGVVCYVVCGVMCCVVRCVVWVVVSCVVSRVVLGVLCYVLCGVVFCIVCFVVHRVVCGLVCCVVYCVVCYVVWGIVCCAVYFKGGCCLDVMSLMLCIMPCGVLSTVCFPNASCVYCKRMLCIWYRFAFYLCLLSDVCYLLFAVRCLLFFMFLVRY